MLIITYCYEDTQSKTTQIWYVGQRKPTNEELVVKVQADCTELNYIIDKFENLPYSSASIQRWYGDMAKFIIGNL
jgi:hypothetical protein